MLPCDCGICEDWLPLGYCCQANALTASSMVDNMIAALMFFIGLLVSCRDVRPVLCVMLFLQPGRAGQLSIPEQLGTSRAAV
jgi:hypothetical protein